MEKQLSLSVYDFNKAINAGSREQAAPFVAPEAQAKFDELVLGSRQRRYNFVMTTDLPSIDYIEAKAKVTMVLLLGEYATQATQKPMAKEVERQLQVWKFEDGAWKWHGSER